MKKILLITFNFQLLTLNLFAQSNWFPQNSGTSVNLKSISFYTINSTGWAVGNSGVMLMTTNGGSNWFQRTSNTSNNLRCVIPAVLNLSSVFAVGANGTVLKSSDSGNNWITLISGTANNLNSVSFRNVLTGIAVGNSGTIIKTTNGGQTWSARTSGTNVNLNNIFAGAYVVGDNGIFLRSFDDGETWTLFNTGTTLNLKSVAGYSWVWAVGDNGTIIRSSNEGTNWTQLNSGTTNNLNSIIWTSPYLFISGDNGTIIKGVVVGNLILFNLENSGTGQNLNSVYFSGRSNGWAAGNNGVILHDTSESPIISSKLLDANTISTWFHNNGSFNSDLVTYNSGFEWPKGQNKHARYASGLWIAAKVGMDTLVTVAEYSHEYLPGYTNNGVPSGLNDTNYRVYKLQHGVNNIDRQRWPNALLGNSDQGAPVYFDSASSSWKPLDYADQTMYYAYTDSYPESHQRMRTLPLKADVKQTNWSYDEPGPIGNMAFTEFSVINKNTSAWNNCYLAFWTDDDIGGAQDDHTGCDTNYQMGYSYNADDYDEIYGAAPPAVGTVLLCGGDTYTGNPNDTAICCDKLRRIIKVGYKPNKIYALNFYSDPPWYPYNYRQGYWYMSGLEAQTGQPIINPVTQQPTRFYYSGDPVTGTGWLQPGTGSNGENGFLFSIGPFNVNPGDTQRFVIGQIIARGTSNLNSITLLRQYAQIAIDNYRNCFANVPIAIENDNEVIYQFRLYQNYPNPFNPVTRIKFDIPSNVRRETADVKLVIYDVLGREITTLLSEELKPGHYEIEWDAANFPSGVYYYRLTSEDASTPLSMTSLTKKMVLIK